MFKRKQLEAELQKKDPVEYARLMKARADVIALLYIYIYILYIYIYIVCNTNAHAYIPNY